MEENTTNIIPENVSPKKQKKLEKIEANLAKKREKSKKIVVLDHFGKGFMMAIVVIAFVAVLLPFGAISLSRKYGEEDVAVADAFTYVVDAVDSKPTKITYTYKSGVNQNKEEFIFKKGVLTGRVSYTPTTKTIVRMPTKADAEYIKQKYPAFTTDDQVTSYIANNTTDYIVLNYTKSGKKWVYSSFSIASGNYSTFAAKGITYLEIIGQISGITSIGPTTITKATAETKYNLFGFGYDVANYTVYKGDTYIVFNGDAVTEVYNFSTLTTYSVNVKF